MRDCMELIERTLDNNSSERSLQDHLLVLVESLYGELETERNSTATLQEIIRDLTKQEDFGFSAKFTALKAAHATLKEKVQFLQNENDDLGIQLIAKGEESKHLFNTKQEEICSYFNKILCKKDDFIKKVQMEADTARKDFQLKEEALYSEIQAVEANANSKLDQMEADCKKQCSEANKKLKDYIETCTVLRMELMSVKEQFAEYKRASNEKVGLLQKRLPANVDCDEEFDVLPSENSRYKPLNMTCKRRVVEDKPVNLKQTSDKMLPPLIPPKPVKKRKLFNPDDLSYLHD